MPVPSFMGNLSNGLCRFRRLSSRLFVDSSPRSDLTLRSRLEGQSTDTSSGDFLSSDLSSSLGLSMSEEVPWLPRVSSPLLADPGRPISVFRILEKLRNSEVQGQELVEPPVNPTSLNCRDFISARFTAARVFLNQ